VLGEPRVLDAEAGPGCVRGVERVLERVLELGIQRPAQPLHECRGEPSHRRQYSCYFASFTSRARASTVIGSCCAAGARSTTAW